MDSDCPPLENMLLGENVSQEELGGGGGKARPCLGLQCLLLPSYPACTPQSPPAFLPTANSCAQSSAAPPCATDLLALSQVVFARYDTFT